MTEPTSFVQSRKSTITVCPCGGETVRVYAPDVWYDKDFNSFKLEHRYQISLVVCKRCDAILDMFACIDH